MHAQEGNIHFETLSSDLKFFLSRYSAFAFNLRSVVSSISGAISQRLEMASYKVKHLHTGAEFTRPAILVNKRTLKTSWHNDIDPEIEAFHKQLPDYGETKLHDLPAVASDLGFAHVFMKDESTRFGLPSFKILGASWAVHRALCQRIGLPSSTTFSGLREALQGRDDIRLVTCSEGNWGRAVARMAKYLSVPLTLYVPGYLNEYTLGLLRGEDAKVTVLDRGSYDDALATAKRDAESSGALIVADTSWTGYEEIPRVSGTTVGTPLACG